MHDGPLTANVIGVIENQAPTRHLRWTVNPVDGEVTVDMRSRPGKDRPGRAPPRLPARCRSAWCRAFGFNARCAIASTVAHDSHHMVVVGTDEADMALAANQLAEMGGGQVVVKEGR